jgi:hypothetical protein
MGKPVLSDRGVITLFISNPLESTNKIRLQQIGGCPKTTDLTLDPLAQAFQFRIEHCSFTPTGGTEQLVVLYDPG